ncbi:hypothetical protein FM104_01525 [Microbacterium esteraromaticum]|uniref:Uncharacterized protein n=1 Tax=Microbacterium esteraromaticum TaxID=57043 RepID=A0A1R4IDA7_9MICO|nr:hypothetical protein FM104_01525 [Microbacterium esteraromaticum]
MFQQCECQCLRAARSADSPITPSARQATTCAVAGAIARPHPGQVYSLTALLPVTGCTVHSWPRRVSVRFHPASRRSKESPSGDRSGRRRCERGIPLVYHQWLRFQKS